MVLCSLENCQTIKREVNYRVFNFKLMKLLKMFRCRNSLFPAFIITRQWCHYSQRKQQKYAAVIIGHYFFSNYSQSYYKVQEASTNGLLCYFFLDTGTFSSDCYLCIFKLAISLMHIFEKDFYYHSKCIMIVICPAIQH